MHSSRLFGGAYLQDSGTGKYDHPANDQTRSSAASDLANREICSTPTDSGQSTRTQSFKVMVTEFDSRGNASTKAACDLIAPLRA